MKRYYNIGLHTFACPTCDVVINSWQEFMEIHAQHAAQFTGDQKKALLQSKCPAFPSYCCASVHRNPAECRRVTLPYYKINDVFGCPACNVLIQGEEDFLREHAGHAGQWHGGQKLILKSVSYKILKFQ
jgi:uncharacterized C2H2 Zn-finger protein